MIFVESSRQFTRLKKSSSLEKSCAAPQTSCSSFSPNASRARQSSVGDLASLFLFKSKLSAKRRNEGANNTKSIHFEV